MGTAVSRQELFPLTHSFTCDYLRNSRNMKYLLLNTDYVGFLKELDDRHPGLEHQPYDAQMYARNESLFGVADFYSRNLKKLGHEAWDIHANNYPLQRAWAKENSLGVIRDWKWQPRLRKRLVPWVSRVPNQQWQYDILAAQIKYYRPDVLLNHDMQSIESSFLKEIKPYCRLLIGQVAYPLFDDQDLGCYDLILSSLPNYVVRFQRDGLQSHLFRLGFEAEILKKVVVDSRENPVSFVGSFSKSHEGRIRLLENLAATTDLQVWGNGVESLDYDSPIRVRYQGPAWGVQMYTVLGKSKMTLNHHIGIA